MEDQPGIKCFQHCDRHTNILCFTLPEMCPLCGQDILTTESRIPPYQIPSPFVSARHNSFAVVIRPTVGTFLRDYENHSNLHVGVTSSKGEVFDFDENGVNINSPTWDQCVAVPVIEMNMIDTCQNWDKQLISMFQSDAWKSSNYNEDKNNCFDFVISFLGQVGQQHNIPLNRFRFCEDFVLPHTTKAAKYISIYRHIVQYGYLCQNAAIS